MRHDDKYLLAMMKGIIGEKGRDVVTPTKGWNTAISNIAPHYTDQRFDSGDHTVWGKQTSDTHYDYSDRLWQWDYKKCQAAFEKAGESNAVRNSAKYYQIFLSEYFGKEVELKHILAGVNRASGYPYQVFGYKFKKNEAD